MSLDQAAGALGVSRRTIYNWIRAGRLQTIRTLRGGSQRVLLGSLREMTVARPHPPEAVVSDSTGPFALS